MAQDKNETNSKRQWGTGSIKTVRIRGGKWGRAIRWYDENGKYKFETLGDVSLRKAEQQLRDRQAEVERRRAKVEKTVPTFSEHVERWLRDVIVPNNKHSTQLDYGNIARKTLVPQFGSLLLSEITPPMGQEFFTTIAPRYRLSTLRGYRKVFRLLMKKAVEWYGLTVNPAATIQLPRANHKSGRVKPPRPKPAVTMQQAAALIDALKSPKARTIVTLAFHTGMRRGELLAIRWSGLDEARSQLHITEAAYEGVIDTPKTSPDRSDNTNKRDVDLEARTLGVLQDWRNVSKRKAPADFIFATRTGTMEDEKNIIHRHVWPACDRLGLPRLSWNGFKRSWQTWAHNSRISERSIADVVGHANAETQKIYIQSLEEEKRKAVDKVSGELHSFCADRSQMSIPFETEEGWVN